MTYYIGADIGTSALKALLVAEDGSIARRALRAYGVSFPRPGWSEQDPALWFDAFVSAVRELTQGGVDVGGIALDGQMHGLVALDEDGEVIRPAILWNDGRTAEETAYLNDAVGRKKLSELTANVAFAGFTAPKILWMRKNEPEAFARIRKIMLPKDYVAWKLTGVFSTDPSDASGTLLFDVKRRRFSKEMLDICGVPEEFAPRVFESHEKVGTLTKEAADALGLRAGIPVAAGAGDNAAAAVGTGAISAGKCNISLGTSGTVFIAADRFAESRKNELHSFCHANGAWHLMGCMLSAASCNEWLCKGILHDADYAALQSRIADGAPGKNHVYFLPYLMGERSPINDTDARGTFTGLRMDTTREDVILAVLEGVAFAIRDNVEAARREGVSVGESTLCGGGAASPLWRHIIADVLNIKIKIPEAEEGPAFGAAILAMVAAGAYPSVPAASEKFLRIKETVLPDAAVAARYEKKYAAFREIYPAMKDVFKKIKETEDDE